VLIERNARWEGDVMPVGEKGGPDLIGSAGYLKWGVCFGIRGG